MTNKPLGSSKELYPLVDYVCVYGLPLSKQTELFTNTQSYSEPGLDGECLIRYPFDDYEKFALPVLLHYFTFPNSIIPSKEPKSIGRDGLSYHSFVMTEENGVKYYGFCVTRWNRCHNRIKCYAPMSLVVLSHHAFHHTFLQLFSNMLDQLGYDWKLFFSRQMCEHIFHLCSTKLDIIARVHFPIGEQRRTVNFAICDEVVRQPKFVEENDTLVHNEKCHYPLCDVDFRILTSNVPVEYLLFLIQAVLTERQILLHSISPYKTTAILEAITALVYPFTWPHVYITTLPPSLYHFLEAPVPYLVGTTTGPFTKTFIDKTFTNDDDIIELPKDVITFDLDTQKLRVVNAHMRLVNAEPKCSLPKMFLTALTRQLQVIYSRQSVIVLESPVEVKNDRLKDLTWNSTGLIQLPGRNRKQKVQEQLEEIQETEYYQVKFSIRRVFLFAFAKTFRTYRLHLNLPKNDEIVDTTTCFQIDAFTTMMCQLHEHKNNDTRPTISFFEDFANSQPFQFFIQRTVEGGEELALFERYVQNRLLKLKDKLAKLEVMTMKGWLFKRGQIRKSWKRRWFELTEKSELKYFTKQYSAAKGSVPVTPNPTNNINAYRAHELDKTDNGTIVVEFPTDFPFLLQSGSRLLYMSADNEQDRRQWVGILRAHLINSGDRDRLMRFIEEETKNVNAPSKKRQTTRISRTGGKTFTVNNRVIDMDAKTEPFMQFLMHKSNFKVRSGEEKKGSSPNGSRTAQKRGVSVYFKFEKEEPNAENVQTEEEQLVADEEEIRLDDGYAYMSDSLAAQVLRNLTVIKHVT